MAMYLERIDVLVQNLGTALLHMCQVMRHAQKVANCPAGACIPLRDSFSLSQAKFIVVFAC